MHNDTWWSSKNKVGMIYFGTWFGNEFATFEALVPIFPLYDFKQWKDDYTSYYEKIKLLFIDAPCHEATIYMTETEFPKIDYKFYFLQARFLPPIANMATHHFIAYLLTTAKSPIECASAGYITTSAQWLATLNLLVNYVLAALTFNPALWPPAFLAKPITQCFSSTLFYYWSLIPIPYYTYSTA
ncbi:MAG: hypothetical protein ACTSRG_12875 [Candidatus Helarchaeota archaeon]